MSTCLSENNGVKARKPHYCALCGERINVGDIQNTRTGVSYGDMWSMHMHPECHAYEQTPDVRRLLHDEDWYEDVSEPAFKRSDVLAALKSGRAKTP